MRLLYFAYGSNLDQNQMMERCPNSAFYKFGVLDKYALCFKGYSEKRKGGVASVEPATSSYVEGVLYNIDLYDLERLDKFEGYPKSYQRKSLPIITDSGEVVKALVYLKPDGVGYNAPSEEYFEIIKKMYRKYSFNGENLAQAKKS